MKKMNVLLGMPNVGGYPMQTVTSLEAVCKTLDYVYPFHVANSLIYTARDMICEYAVKKGFDYVLMVDSDMVFSPSDVENIVKIAETGKDIVSGTYVTRVGDPRIVAYSSITKRQLKPFREPNVKNVFLYSDEELEKVAAVGMGFCLIRTELLAKMKRDYVSLFEPKWGLGEDIAFCERANRYTDIYLTRKIKLGHLGSWVNNVPPNPFDEHFDMKSAE